MGYDNEMVLEIASKSENEGFARTVAAAFVMPLNPTLEEMADVKTAISEAVTNAVIHGYGGGEGKIRMWAAREGGAVYFEIEDYGSGIADIKQAMEPLYTSKPEDDRSGMGFTFMEAFMDGLQVSSEPGKGTKVRMKKCFAT